MLHAKFLRSPHAHAIIKSIDTSRAKALPGVHATVTSEDLPDVKDDRVNLGEDTTNVKNLQLNVLARDKALYKGHAIAAVAAVTPHIAEEAAALIDVKYEVLPAVLTAPDAMTANAPILHDDLMTEEFGERTENVSNVAEHFQYRIGDIGRGFSRATVVIEREFNTATVHQGYIEPQVASALWNKNDRIEIWTSTQGAFTVRTEVAQVLR